MESSYFDGFAVVALDSELSFRVHAYDKYSSKLQTKFFVLFFSPEDILQRPHQLCKHYPVNNMYGRETITGIHTRTQGVYIRT